MLEEYNTVFSEYNSLPKCGEDCQFQLSVDELPEEWPNVDTCFALYCNSRCHTGKVIILENGTCGYECKVEKSIWYFILEKGRVVPSHKIGSKIDYKFKNGWIKQ